MSSCPSWCWEQAHPHLLWLPSSPSWYCSCVAVLYTRHLYQSCLKHTQHPSDLLSCCIQTAWAHRRMLEVQEGCAVACCCFGSVLSVRRGGLPCILECSCVFGRRSHLLHWLCTVIKSLCNARTTVCADQYHCSATTSDAPSAGCRPPCFQTHTHQSCCMMLIHRLKCFMAACVNRLWQCLCVVLQAGVAMASVQCHNICAPSADRGPTLHLGHIPIRAAVSPPKPLHGIDTVSRLVWCCRLVWPWHLPES